MIYKPAEDSYLLEGVVKDYLKDKEKSIKILDMGSGSGIQAQACIGLGFKNVLAVDINPEVITHLKTKDFNTLQSDLFSKIEGKFDIIIFNAPYLPEDEREPEDIKLATTAGKEGYEVIVRFLKESKEHLSKDGKILLLFSSLSRPEVILSKADELGYKHELISSSKLDFEKLYVYRFEL